MPRRRANPHLIPGRIAQYKQPEWRPLEETVGELARYFMWMGEMELADGTSMHAYKHSITRRYLHLGMDGRAFDYVALGGTKDEDRSAYRPISKRAALEEAFHNWDRLTADDEDREVAGKLELAHQYAARGEPMPVNEEWALRQREFERVAHAARLHEREHQQPLDQARFTGDQFYGDLEHLDETLSADEAHGAV